MTTEKKLQKIEEILGAEPYTLTEGTQLASLPQWDSLNILNLQIEFTETNPGLQFDDLFNCKTAGELCKIL